MASIQLEKKTAPDLPVQQQQLQQAPDMPGVKQVIGGTDTTNNLEQGERGADARWCCWWWWTG